MCIRIQTCCGANLRSSTLFIAYYSVAVTITSYFLGGYYLFYWLTHPARGAYEAADNDSILGAYGSLYLAFAGLWTVVTAALLVSLYSDAIVLMLPWLALQMLSIGLAIVNVVTEVVIMNYMAFVGIPFILIGFIMFIIVYSHFMDLHETHIGWRTSAGSFPSISRGVV